MKIFNKDCFDVYKELKNNSIDFVFIDPPFNVNKRYDGFKDVNDNYYEWCNDWIEESFRVLKPSGSMTIMTITKHLPYLFPMLNNRGVFINQVIWKNPSSSPNTKSFKYFYQSILIYGKSEDYKFNRYAQTSNSNYINTRWGNYTTERKGQLGDIWDDIPFVYSGSIKHKEAILKPNSNVKAHPCQMPLNLISRLILFLTDEGDIVFDPFMGSGTTVESCLIHKRIPIACDISKTSFDITIERIKNFGRQCKLI